MNKRITEAFAKEKAFIPFVTCGDPSLDVTEKIVYTMEEAGADLIELGIPFSDPTAEGPVIQGANLRALSGGVTTDKVFDMVEQMPQFPGGPSELMKYIADHMKYPTIAQENGTQGRVTCQFVVGSDGSVRDVKVLRGVDPYLDKEAIRVIKSMPKWIPGKQNGKAVSVKYTVPIIFKLQ